MESQITLMFKALSDPNRRKIFHSLIIVSSVLSISQIATNFDMTRQGVTKHIKVLEKATLVTISSQGRERYCKANPAPLKEINKWLGLYEKFWDDSLQNLSSYLDRNKEV